MRTSCVVPDGSSNSHGINSQNDHNDAGVRDNTATVTGTAPDGVTNVTVSDSHSEPIPQAPAIGVLKTADPTTVFNAGDLVTPSRSATAIAMGFVPA